MAHFEENSEAMVALEAMVDATSIRVVLRALSHIAWAKADHLRSNWQDENAAKSWERDARKLGKYRVEN